MMKALDWAMIALVTVVAASGCAGPQSPPQPPSSDIIGRLGFDPSTVAPEHEGNIGEPGLPAGFTYKNVVPQGKYDDTDVIALDPTERYLFFVAHLQYPDGSVYRVDLSTGHVIRLTTGLHRPGGIAYYQPGNVLLVAEEGTGAGPQERQLGFYRAVRPDIADQPTPPPLRAMGQYRGEGVEVASPDTIYLGEDQPNGGPIYKYILDSPPDLSRGTLYVFKENQGWIKTAVLDAPDTGKEGTNFYAGEDMHLGPDGKLYLVLSARAETRVVAIDLTTARVTNFVTATTPYANKRPPFESPDQLAFAPNGTLFITAGGDVWAAIPDGPDEDTLSDGVYRFLTGLDVVQGIWFTRDGSTFYVAARARADVVLAITGFKFQ